MGFWSSFTEHVAGPLVDLGANLLGNHSAKKEAQANRDWQEELSNTAVQRRVADMKKAGINPVLSVSGASSGASTPTGGQANIQHYRFNPDSVLALSNARLVNAQAKAQENDNDLYEFKKRAFELDNRLKDVRYELIKAQSDNERVKIIMNTFKAQGIPISNAQAWYNLDVLKMQYDINHKGLYDEDNLINYPGYVNNIIADYSKSPFGILGSMVGDGVSSTAKHWKNFRDSFYYWLDEISKNRQKFNRR